MKTPTRVSVTCLLAAGIAILAGIARAEQTIAKKPFGKVGGTPVDLYTLTNSKGMQAAVTNYGGIVVSLRVPDRKGKLDDVVLGYDKLDDYVKSSPYFGAIIGRYGNRIGKAQFTLGGKEYTLAKNDKENHLHGGTRGFDKVVWKAKAMFTDKGPGLMLTYWSADGEEGYPGNLTVSVIYVLTEENELTIRYQAVTDKPTPVNLTNHSYFNLAGQGSGDILGHELMIYADQFTPVDQGLIPTGELRSVQGTPFDFRRRTAIGKRIGEADEQLKFGLGYDHNWVLNKKPGETAMAARVYEPSTRRVLEVLTSEPGLQFYSGNFLDGSNVGKDGKAYKHRYGFCLEMQHFPDSPNKPEFPSTILEPGKEYSTTTIYRFLAR